MEIKEMQQQAYKIIEDYNKKHGLSHNKDTVFYHLIEEVGELSRELYHEKNNWRAEFNKEKFSEELIDVLMQILNLSKDYNIDIEQEFNNKIEKLRERFDLEEQKVYKLTSSNKNNMLPGNPQGLPDESFSKDTLMFIDSSFLSKLSKHFGNGRYLIYDLIDFSENLCKKQKLVCKKIFYYTAPPFQSPNPTIEEEKKKEGYEKFINKLKLRGVIVREGRCQRLKCEGEFVYKQKAVDILLAMDLSNVLIKYPPIRRIILISSDSDFVPVVENLRENGIKTILYTYYEKIRDTPFSRSNHLIKSVYKYVLLTKEDFIKFPIGKQ